MSRTNAITENIININIRISQAEVFVQRNEMKFIKPKDKLILMLWDDLHKFICNVTEQYLYIKLELCI